MQSHTIMRSEELECVYNVLIIPTPAQPSPAQPSPAQHEANIILILTLVPRHGHMPSRGQTSGPPPQPTRARHAGHVTHVIVTTLSSSRVHHNRSVRHHLSLLIHHNVFHQIQLIQRSMIPFLPLPLTTTTKLTNTYRN